MGNWGIIVPTASTNYIHNPAFRYGVDGWSAYTTETATGTRTRGVDYAMKGYYSYQIDKTSAADTGAYGIYHTVSDFADFDEGDILAISAYVSVEDGARVALTAAVSYAVGSQSINISQDGPYTGRISIATTLTADATAIEVRAYVPDDYAGYFYITGIQLELDQVTTYFDGFTDGCYWAGEYASSNSIRPITARQGGTETDFNDYAFYITDATGMGSARTGHKMEQFSNLPGGYRSYSRSPIRTASLVGELIGTSLTDLHDKRDALLSLFNTNAVGDKEVTIYYDGSGDRLYLDVLLDSGFENLDRDGFNERIALRLNALKPYWYRGYQSSQELDVLSYVSGYKVLQYLSDGAWSYAGGVTGAPTVNAIVYHKGKIYVGGDFSSVIDSVANTQYLAVYDGSSWAAIGGTGPDDEVRAIAFDSDDNMYIGGDFTSVNSVANTAYIAYFDGTDWNDCDGATIDGAVYDIQVFKNNRVYVAGAQTDQHYVCYYTGPTGGDGFVDIGSGISATVTNIAVDAEENIYAGGGFANVGGDTDMSRIAKWNGTAWTALDTGVNDTVNKIIVHSSGDVYVGGDFTTVSGVSIARLAKWNGVAWEEVGSGFVLSSGGVDAMCELPNGDVYFCGSLSTSNDGYDTGSFIWNGYDYRNLTANAAGDSGAAFGGIYDLISSDTGSSHALGEKNTIAYEGTALAYPVFRFKHISGAIFVYIAVEQPNTGGNIYIQHDIYSGEEIIINGLQPGSVEYNLPISGYGIVLGSSKLSDIYLEAGNNDFTLLAAHANPAPTIEMAVYWTPRYWSMDGA